MLEKKSRLYRKARTRLSRASRMGQRATALPLEKRRIHRRALSRTVTECTLLGVIIWILNAPEAHMLKGWSSAHDATSSGGNFKRRGLVEGNPVIGVHP